MSYLASNMFSLPSIKVICVHLVIIRATPWAKYAYVFSMGKKKNNRRHYLWSDLYAWQALKNLDSSHNTLLCPEKITLFKILCSDSCSEMQNDNALD